MSAVTDLPFNVTDLRTTDPDIRFVKVTPELASRWLGANVHNRNIRPKDVARYARDMAAGDWKVTGDAIKFSRSQILLDGQHRLHAVIKSGVTVPMFIATDIDEEAQSVMDTGSRRTAGDMLHLTGYKHASLIAAATKIALQIDAGLGGSNNFTPTHSQIVEYVEANPGLVELSGIASKLARSCDCPPAVVLYTMYVLSMIDADQAVRFWVDAAEKVGLSAGDPVLAMTKRFAELRRTRSELSRTNLLSIVYRTWNARRSGSTLRHLRIRNPKGTAISVPRPR